MHTRPPRRPPRSQNVVHRDLKPENFLLASADLDADVKLTDFGLSAVAAPDVLLNEGCGSAYYIAPEILNKSGYNTPVGSWLRRARPLVAVRRRARSAPPRACCPPAHPPRPRPAPTPPRRPQTTLRWA